MAIFDRVLDISSAYVTIQQNGSSVTQRGILNFVGTQFTITDDPGNSRTDITFPNYVLQAGDTMTGPLILSGDPTLPLGAVTKQYVDSISSGLSPRTSCRIATTAALTVTYNNGTSGVGATLTNAGTQAALLIDGVTLSVNDRVLVKDQASTFQNGIYTVTNIGSGATNWILTRATDYDTASPNEVVEGSYTVISEGTTNATNLFVETGQGPFTIGTTPIIFSAFNSAANINVTAPLTKTGNTIALTTPLTGQYGGTGINNGSNTVTLGGNILTGGSFTTSGANPLTLTTTGTTNVTLPTSGTLVNTAVTTLSSLSSIGTITTGTWNGTLISPIYGGTGINNGSSTLTLGGNLATSGAFASTFTMTGATNVTFPTSGTLATTAQLPTFPISLANGGTSASLTASNGGVFYSTASAGAILAGTATANQVLLSGASSAPAWSTATYPATTTINQILYSSSANTIVGITTGNSGVLITSVGGVPSISSTIPSATQANITSLGTITSGTWNGTIITGQYGGTGVANTGKTITLGGNLTTSGAFGSTFTMTNTTSVTFPTTGTLLSSANNLSDVASAATSRTNLGVDVCLYQVATQTFTSSGTYTPTSNMIYCIIEVWGGGGGGGGAQGVATQTGGAGGGGAGGYSRHLATAASIGASQTVTIGAAGTAGAAGNNAGGSGGDTSLGVLAIAKGATGGPGSPGNGAGSSNAAGGIAGTGNIITANGACGGSGNGSPNITAMYAIGGIGASSPVGGGGGVTQTASTQSGGVATGFASGGGGGATMATTSTVAGGAGKPGLCVITEFIKRA